TKDTSEPSSSYSPNSTVCPSLSLARPRRTGTTDTSTPTSLRTSTFSLLLSPDRSCLSRSRNSGDCLMMCSRIQSSSSLDTYTLILGTVPHFIKLAVQLLHQHDQSILV